MKFRLDESNELEQRAKKHKKTDVKGAIGWFQNPGDPKTMAIFNNSVANGEGGETMAEDYDTSDNDLTESTSANENIFDKAQKVFGKEFAEKHSIGYLLDAVDALQESILEEDTSLSAQDKQELKKVIEATDDPETIAAFLKIKKDGITEDLNKEFKSYLSSNPKKINTAMKLFNVNSKEELSEKLDSAKEDEIEAIFEKVSKSRLITNRAKKCMKAIEEAIKMTNSDDYDEIAEIANAITDDEFGIIGDTVREYYDSLNSKIETHTPKLYKSLADYDNDYIAWDAEVGKQRRSDMYRYYLGVDDDYEITEDNLSENALNYVSCYDRTPVERIKEELLNKNNK